jgi:hypothetical protein
MIKTKINQNQNNQNLDFKGHPLPMLLHHCCHSCDTSESVSEKCVGRPCAASAWLQSEFPFRKFEMIIPHILYAHVIFIYRYIHISTEYYIYIIICLYGYDICVYHVKIQSQIGCSTSLNQIVCFQ